VSFLNKAAIQVTLTSLPKGTEVIIDGTNSRYIDPDVLEIIQNYYQNAHTKNIHVQLHNIHEKYDVPSLKQLMYNSNQENHENRKSEKRYTTTV
jgi:SulP family sulfate permease